MSSRMLLIRILAMLGISLADFACLVDAIMMKPTVVVQRPAATSTIPASWQSGSVSPFLRIPQENQHHQKSAAQDASGPKKQKARGVKYSFGIGVHRPVASATAASTNQLDKSTTVSPAQRPENTYEAAAFWSQHTAVQEYPNPTVTAAAVAGAAAITRGSASSTPNQQQQQQQTLTNPRRKPQPIIPQRRFANDFVIQHDQITASSVTDTPIIKKSLEVQHQFDVNTAWVEMFIYDQQMMHSESSATSLTAKRQW